MKVSLNFEFNSNEEAEAFLRQVRERAERVEIRGSTLEEAAAPPSAKRQRKKTETQTVSREQAPLPKPEKVEGLAPAKELKIEDVQKSVEAIFDQHGMETCRALLSRFGVSRARDLKPEQYAAFIAEAKRVLDGKDPAVAA